MDRKLQDDRYSRQIYFPKIGKEGQDKLLKSKVIVIGCGGLGTSIANYMVRAGFGSIKIVDHDVVELNNLQRQLIFDEGDVGAQKVVAIKEKLEKINGEVEIESVVCDVNPENVESLIKGMDLVLDGTDNMETRFLINDACVKNNIKWIYGAAVSSVGSTMNIIPGESPCLRCIIGSLPQRGSLPTCNTMGVGIVNTLPATIASLQVIEAIKIIIGDKDISSELIYFDVWERIFNKFSVKRNPECLTCIKRRFEILESKK